MPLCTLHLIRLHRQNQDPHDKQSIFASRRQFLKNLIAHDKALNERLLLACVVRRPVIVANRIDTVYLNATPWDLLLLFQGADSTESTSLCLESHPTTGKSISAEYVVQTGIPSRILESYEQKSEDLLAKAQVDDVTPLDNEYLLSNPSRSFPPYAPKTSQNLEMSPDLIDLIEALEHLSEGDGLVNAAGPVQQFNLLSFKKSQEDKERYHQYGKVCSAWCTVNKNSYKYFQNFNAVAQNYGGSPKILGKVIGNSGREGRSPTPWWDEVSLVHYHSIRHFAAMSASSEYQDINRKYRLPSLDDTSIICTQEVDLAGLRSQLYIPAAQARM